eukprot:2217782-Alexandrium_andersonii.AAC.1
MIVSIIMWSRRAIHHAGMRPLTAEATINRPQCCFNDVAMMLEWRSDDYSEFSASSYFEVEALEGAG